MKSKMFDAANVGSYYLCKGCSFSRAGMHCTVKDMYVGQIVDCPCINCLVKPMCIDKVDCGPRQRMILSAMEKLWKSSSKNDLEWEVVNE